MARVVWPDDALVQIYEIAAYIRAFDPVAAVQMTTRLWDLGQSLTDFPNRGRPAANGIRELVTVPPYILSYRIDGDIVTVVAIRPSARQPLD